MSLIGIICAIRPEAKPIVDMLGLTLLENSPFPIYQGELNGNNYHLSICGQGKASAAAASQSLIDRFGVIEIFNVGICGALCDELKITDIVVSTCFVQHDFSIDEEGEHSCWHPTLKNHLIETDLPNVINNIELHSSDYRFGTIASGDKFIKSKALKNNLFDQSGAIAVDMESAAIALVCTLNKVGFVSIRAVSDLAESIPHDFDQNMEKAICNVSELLRKTLLAPQHYFA